MSLSDGWRLSVGTLTRVPVRPPAVIDRASGGAAMLLAPLTAVPAALVVGLLVWAGSHGVVAPGIVGLLGVGFLAWFSRLLHLDGLSDTVDGLTASHDRTRSLQVMRSGTAGPAGVVALVVVLGLQAVGLTALTAHGHGALIAGACVVASRAALAVACSRGIPPARPEGLGATVASTVAPVAALLVALLAAGLVWASLGWGHHLVADFPRAIAWFAPALAAVAVAVCLRIAVRRLGGVTGDVLGACVEVALAVLLLSVA